MGKSAGTSLGACPKKPHAGLAQDRVGRVAPRSRPRWPQGLQVAGLPGSGWPAGRAQVVRRTGPGGGQNVRHKADLLAQQAYFHIGVPYVEQEKSHQCTPFGRRPGPLGNPAVPACFNPALPEQRPARSTIPLFHKTNARISACDRRAAPAQSRPASPRRGGRPCAGG